MIVKDEFRRIIDTYSTPSFVFDEDEVLARAGKIRDILGDIAFCYSVKANPFLIPTLLTAVDHFEVCSPGELSICRELDVPPEKVIYSGVHKEQEDISDAIRYGAEYLTAESCRQYDFICESARRTSRRINTLLRLTSGNQFGMSQDDIEKILGETTDAVNYTGLHYFAGTGRHKLQKQKDELKKLSDTICVLRDKYDLELPMIEYGPGLPFPYFTDEDFSDTLAPLKELSPVLHETSVHCRLSVEMGRFLASSCGYYLTSVRDIKRSGGTNWCIVDGGINHVNYFGQMMGMKIPLIDHYRDGEFIDDIGGESWTICGSLCTTNDILVRSLPLNEPVTGDVLIFRNIGAYSVTEAMGLFLSRTLPRIIAVSDEKTRLLRERRESWEINIPAG